jgi:hypothetical protein
VTNDVRDHLQQLLQILSLLVLVGTQVVELLAADAETVAGLHDQV